MHKKVNFSCYEWDIIYILNCICLTKDILKNGRPEFFERYFKKEKYNTYMYDLTIMQKLIGYKANRIFYDFHDYDFFIGQTDYINLGDREFNFLFGKQRKERLKEIEQEEKFRKQITKFNEIPKITKNHFFTNFWKFRKNA